MGRGTTEKGLDGDDRAILVCPPFPMDGIQNMFCVS